MGTSRSDSEVQDGWDHGVSGAVVGDDHVVHVEHIWGTSITINVSGIAGRSDRVLSAIDRCREFFVTVDQTFSTYKPATEVALYRSGLERPGQQSHDFEEVMLACRRVRELTQGAFDPWAVPGGYDPSGYVKGWAAGRASEMLVAAGFSDHLVNAGGDITASGDELPGSGHGWPTGILNPHIPSEVIEVVDLQNESMATSGRYERGDHVIDPLTGRPAIDVDSATVVGPDPGVADALASAVLVRGTASVSWFDPLGPEWSLYLVMGKTAHSYGRAFDGSGSNE